MKPVPGLKTRGADPPGAGRWLSAALREPSLWLGIYCRPRVIERSKCRKNRSRLRLQANLVARAQRGEEAAVRTIIRQNNRRLFRLARSIMKDDNEAEDVVQETYVRAFTRLAEFRGESRLATWLTRIVINEGFGRLRRRRTRVDWESVEATYTRQALIIPFPTSSAPPDPERPRR